MKILKIFLIICVFILSAQTVMANDISINYNNGIYHIIFWNKISKQCAQPFAQMGTPNYSGL